MKKNFLIITIAFFGFLFLGTGIPKGDKKIKSENKSLAKLPPEEGMFPLSEISKLDLQAAGLQISPKEIFNPNGTSLIDALVRLSGCTGSFVSGNGLIVTNHHCAFSAVAAASTTENNYLENGFAANEKSQEIQAKGLTCRITDAYEDVSNRVLEGADSESDPIKRLQKIAANIQKIQKEEQAKDPDRLIEISEMFIGKTYVLFRYKTIKDVRLVYVPPRSIGEFGGETDNWVWPRHTGDFSFVRAYVAPDGSPAEYSENNVPYKPVKHLKINPNGVSEEDFVFILGYPGRTYRHRPAQYLVYQRDHLLPYISETFDWLIHYMEKLGDQNPEKKLLYATQIKRYANTTKNFKGKMQGLRRVPIIQNKIKEEKALQAAINKNPKLKKQYGNVLPEINKTYDDILEITTATLWFGRLYAHAPQFNLAGEIALAQKEMQDMSKTEKAEYIEKQSKKFVRMAKSANSKTYSQEMEKDFLKMMFQKGLTFKGKQEVAPLAMAKADVENFVETLFEKSKFNDPAAILEMAENKPAKLFNLKDPMVEYSAKFNPIHKKLLNGFRQGNAKVSALMPQLLEAKQAVSEENFIPDANGTLRLTYGHIRGYHPEDAVYQKPFTTLAGVVEKGRTAKKGSDYEMPEILAQLHDKGDLGKYTHPKLKDVPVGLLYDMDTSGGNSGSPIMNAKGEFIGINFDRAYTATINDFAWNQAYSRSIGVDVRYMLFVLEKVANAQNLLTEMQVN